MNELAVRTQNVIQTMDDVERAAKAMATSGFFQDASQLAQATVKILAGQEIGIGAFASMVGIHIIKGKPTYGANIIAAKVKGSGKYDYTVDEMSEKACRLTFWQGDREIGKSIFTIEDAKKAGTQNTEKFPRNMLFARAISNGQKWYCPDVTFVTMYTPEEFGAIVDDGGNITNAAEVKLNVVIGEVKEEKPAMTIEKAREMKTTKGAEFGTLNATQLNALLGYDISAEKREAVMLILKTDFNMEDVATDPRTGDGENQ